MNAQLWAIAAVASWCLFAAGLEGVPVGARSAARKPE